MSRLSLKLSLLAATTLMSLATARAQAQTAFMFDEGTEAMTSKTCTTCGAKIKSVLTAKIDIKPVPIVTDRTLVSFRNARAKDIDPRCRSYIDANGNYGAYGRAVSSLISSSQYSRHYMNNRSLAGVCPKFSKLSDAQKTKAWTWFWMVLANEESNCDVDLPHTTHDDSGNRINYKRGWGMFAAELFEQDRAWRGSICRGNIKTAHKQFTCAIGTMADLQLADGGTVLASDSYWGPVRRYGRQIMPNMRGFKSCF